jgi:hypothetical protein
MRKGLPVPYIPAMTMLDGWRWCCAWCGEVATAPATSWDAAIDALMDEHTADCAAYQLWLKALDKGTKQKGRPRRKRPEEQLTFESL